MYGCNQLNVLTVNMIIMAFFCPCPFVTYSTANHSELPGKGFNILGRIYQTINIDKLISAWSERSLNRTLFFFSALFLIALPDI